MWCRVELIQQAAQWCLPRSNFLLHQPLPQVGNSVGMLSTKGAFFSISYPGLIDYLEYVRENTRLHRWLLVLLPNVEAAESHRTTENG